MFCLLHLFFPGVLYEMYTMFQSYNKLDTNTTIILNNIHLLIDTNQYVFASKELITLISQ